MFVCFLILIHLHYTFVFMVIYLFLFKGWSGLMYVHAKHLNEIDEVMYFSFSNMISNKTKIGFYYSVLYQ